MTEHAITKLRELLLESDAAVEAAIRHLLAHKEDIESWARVLRVAERNKKRIQWVSRTAQIARILLTVDTENESIMYTGTHDGHFNPAYASPASLRNVVKVGIRSMESVDA